MSIDQIFWAVGFLKRKKRKEASSILMKMPNEEPRCIEQILVSLKRNTVVHIQGYDKTIGL